ncbi:hypothetical protein Tco_0837710, partial [Tanacetum coccineum]
VIDDTSTILVSVATITDVEVTLAQALAELKSAKPKADKVVIQKPEQATSWKKEEEERLAREKAQQIEEANIAWDDVQAKVDADYQLAQRLHAQEQEELTDKEKVRLFVQFLEQRRKHFAAKRAEEKRNKPPTQAQQRKIIRCLTKLSRGSSKRAGEELEQESINKQKVDEDRETAGLQSLIKVIPDEEEVAIDVVPLATKPPTIVDWKIHKEGKKSYYQIIRADGKSGIQQEASYNWDNTQIITHNTAFQTDDLDAYDSDCDDISLAKAVLMADLSNCDFDVISKVSYSDTFQNDMMNQSVHEL